MMPLAESVVAPAVAPALTRRRPCVLDPRLALSTGGLLAAARLTAECSVWLPRELRETLKNPTAYREQPDKLAPRVYGAHRRGLASCDRDIGDAIDQWAAVLEGRSPVPRFCYLGERAGEGVLPGNVDDGVHERFERLASRLDVLMQAADYDLPRGASIAACFRDAAALCAALAPYGAFIMSVLEADGRAAPALCNYLDAWRVPVVDVTSKAGVEADVLRGYLGRAGLGPVEWAGARLAAVHVLPRGLGTDPAPRDPWAHAQVYWHLVGAS